MRVLYIAVGSEFGGAARSMLEMVSTIKKMYPEIDPVVLCCHKHGHIDEYKKNGIEAYPTLHRAFCFGREDEFIPFVIKYIPRYILYVVFDIYAFLYIKKNLDIQKIDIIHSNATRNDIGLVLSKKYKIPHVLHLREFGRKGLDYDVKYYRPNAIQYINQRVTRFIAITEIVKKHWVKEGIDEEKIDVVYNGINNLDIIKKSNYDVDDKVKFVFTGYIRESKGQMQLLKALTCLKPNILRQISVDFIGTGVKSYMQKLMDFTVTNGLSDNVTFLGKREDVHQILHNYDIGLVCSRAEAFGRITPEYMLAGLCVLASNTGGNKELIENNQSGILYKYGDIYDLTEKITMLTEDGSLRKKMALQGYDRACERFLTEINAANVVNVYKKVLGEKYDFG